MERDLIFDLGMHRGEESEFYLKKGFRVIAVEASPELCCIARATLAAAMADGRLTIVAKAVAGRSGPITFHETRGERWSVWGTCKPEWAERNRRRGADSGIFLRYALVGDDGYVRHPLARRVLGGLGMAAGWYDTHARHREAAP
ncbi:MAG TPA: hypothetical protein VGW34_15195 [Allosphingosinicella sp.]|nr:hypothetical protein [Allosphingosinicella sp.]